MTTLTTDAIFEGQRFAILAMFLDKVVELVKGGSVINGAYPV